MNQPATQSKPQHSLAALSGRKPPQNVDVERKVLGAIIIEPDALHRVCETLKPKSFYAPAHQAIFTAIQKLRNANKPADLATIVDQLAKDGSLDKVGGPSYIAELTFEVVSSANIEYHAKIIEEHRLRRGVIALSSKVQGMAYDTGEDVFDMLDALANDISNLSTDNSTQRDMGSIVQQCLSQIATAQTQPPGTQSPFHQLDIITQGWQPSDLVIVAARPGMGKTAFVLSCALQAALNGTRTIVFSLEMSAQQLTMRLLSSLSGIPLERLRKGAVANDEQQSLKDAASALALSELEIDDTPALDINALKARIRKHQVSQPVGMLVVDYLQLLAGNKGKNETREQEVSKLSRGLKQLAKEIKAPVLALSQLSRAVEQRVDKRPMLSDLRDSGGIEQDADVVVFLYRPEYYGITEDEHGESVVGKCEAIVAKHRNGPTGTAVLGFKAKTATFTA